MRIDEIASGMIVAGLPQAERAEVLDLRFIAPDTLWVQYRSVSEVRWEFEDFLVAVDVGRIRLLDGSRASMPPFMYPTGVPHLFADETRLWNLLKGARARGRLHAAVEAYISMVASRLSSPFHTVSEIHAVAGARNDALSTDGEIELLWEVFATASQVEGDLRKLEREQRAHRVRIAVAVDPEVDADVYEEFVRRAQGSPIATHFRVGDLMLADRFSSTIMRLNRGVVSARAGMGGVEVLGVSLDPESVGWRALPKFPLSFARDIQVANDPVIWVDLLNHDRALHLVRHAYRRTRFREAKPHGLPFNDFAVPTYRIEVPMDDGAEGLARLALDPPVPLPGGAPARLEILLRDIGYAWRGEVDLGFVLDGDTVVTVPTISIFV